MDNKKDNQMIEIKPKTVLLVRLCMAGSIVFISIAIACFMTFMELIQANQDSIWMFLSFIVCVVLSGFSASLGIKVLVRAKEKSERESWGTKDE